MKQPSPSENSVDALIGMVASGRRLNLIVSYQLSDFFRGAVSGEVMYEEGRGEGRRKERNEKSARN